VLTENDLDIDQGRAKTNESSVSITALKPLFLTKNESFTALRRIYSDEITY